MPLAPLGCAVEMHESTNRQKSWDPHSLSGWYLGTSTEHYCCHRIFCKKTRSERISDTVYFLHCYITQPTVTPEDQLIKAVGDLSSVLGGQTNDKGRKEMAALKRLQGGILNNTTVSKQTKKNKTVTFKDPIPEPRVSRNTIDLQQSPKKIATAPRVLTKAVIDKPLRITQISRPITRSKYAQAVEALLKRGRRSQSQPRNQMEELAQAVLDDDPRCAVEYANEIFDEESGKLMKYRQLITHPKYKEVWFHSSANEFGRLAQGVGGRIQGTNTIFFIHKHQIPTDRWKDITYAKFVCELKPNKVEVHRTRLTVGGDKVHYPGDVGTPTADLTLVKMHLNSVISTPGARYMTLDVKNFYLNTPMSMQCILLVF